MHHAAVCLLVVEVITYGLPKDPLVSRFLRNGSIFMDPQCGVNLFIIVGHKIVHN